MYKHEEKIVSANAQDPSEDLSLVPEASPPEDPFGVASETDASLPTAPDVSIEEDEKYRSSNLFILGVKEEMRKHQAACAVGVSGSCRSCLVNSSEFDRYDAEHRGGRILEHFKNKSLSEIINDKKWKTNPSINSGSSDESLLVTPLKRTNEISKKSLTCKLLKLARDD